MGNYSFKIRFGYFEDPIQEQLRRQGFKFSVVQSNIWEKLSKGIIKLHNHGIVKDSEKDKMQRKLIEKIAEHLKKLNP